MALVNSRIVSDVTYTPVAAMADLPSGAKKLVMVGTTPVLLCHDGDQIYAISNHCSHAQEPLDCGRMRNGWISCPVHGARFDLATGEALNPPASEPIQTYPVRIVGEMIEVAI
ncbi:MAG: non-heme iron oxygenase ferredoxin subunit [Novosphingobium sp.]